MHRGSFQVFDGKVLSIHQELRSYTRGEKIGSTGMTWLALLWCMLTDRLYAIQVHSVKHMDMKVFEFLQISDESEADIS